MNMPLSYIDALYRIAEERLKTEEGKKQLEQKLEEYKIKDDIKEIEFDENINIIYGDKVLRIINS